MKTERTNVYENSMTRTKLTNAYENDITILKPNSLRELNEPMLLRTV